MACWRCTSKHMSFWWGCHHAGQQADADSEYKLTTLCCFDVSAMFAATYRLRPANAPVSHQQQLRRVVRIVRDDGVDLGEGTSLVQMICVI